MHEHTDYSMKTNIYFYAFLNLLWYLGKQHSHKTCLLLKKKKKMNLQSVPQSGENTGSKFSNKIPQETNLHSKTGTEIELIK